MFTLGTTSTTVSLLAFFSFFKHLKNFYKNLYVKSTLTNIRRISDFYISFLMTRLYIVQYISIVFVMLGSEYNSFYALPQSSI